MKNLVILAPAAKALRKHRSEASRLLEKLGAYAADPAPFANNVVRLAESSALRLRVGDFRIIFEETETEIIVTKIGPLGSFYE